MIAKQPMLQAALGPKAQAFGGGSAGANVGLIQSLPENEKAIARLAFSDSLSTMWIVYVAFSATGLAVSFLITKNVLTKQHEETKTGLEAEKAKKLERDAERAEKKKKRASKGDLHFDVDAPTEAVQEKGVKV
jgi:mannitol-specific phosphotransferase system IIBC component